MMVNKQYEILSRLNYINTISNLNWQLTIIKINTPFHTKKLKRQYTRVTTSKI